MRSPPLEDQTGKFRCLMKSYTSIIRQAYNKYLLKFGKCQIQTPYRINVPYQEDRRKYGKSDPKELKNNVIQIAKEKQLDINQMSCEQILNFMKENKLGIDCSGFSYHIINYLLKKVKQTNLQEIGFPKASLANVKCFLSRKLTYKISSYKQLQPGDLVIQMRENQLGKPHMLIVLKKYKHKVVLIHSSYYNNPAGIGILELSRKDLLHNNPAYMFRRLILLK